MDAWEHYALAWSHEGLSGFDAWKCNVPEGDPYATLAPSRPAPRPAGPTFEVARTCWSCGGRRTIPASVERPAAACRACDGIGIVVEEIGSSPILLRLLDEVVPRAAFLASNDMERRDAAA